MVGHVSSRTFPEAPSFSGSFGSLPFFPITYDFWISYLKSLQGNAALFNFLGRYESFHFPPTDFPFVPIFVWLMK